MNAQQIWDAICSLARSQGLYGRIKEAILESGRQDEILHELEQKNFADVVDMVMFFEC